jgi:ribosomal protein L16/L10AE
MVDDFYRQTTRFLRAAGYVRVQGGKGSHEKWHSLVLNRQVLVPRNLKSRFTANGILASAGLKDRV